MKKTVTMLLIFFLVITSFNAYINKLHSTLQAKEQKASPSYNYTLPQTSTLSEYGLVNLNDLSTNLLIDLRYASKDNFTGEQIYPSISFAILREETAEKLKNANEELYQLGYRIKIWDAYRPHRYQFTLREVAEKQNPKTASFVANPTTGSNHNRAASVDITLTDLQGREVDMPTGFDHFGPEASINYTGCTKEQIKNRELLGTIMEKHGFKRIKSEWWHFDDVECKNYDILDLDFIELYD